ncbi:MAG: hypothetical protein K0R63_432 [Rickettsiales bacterium]|jgi:SAM-dependent methyltransferase|nr:hypothetical protein [Rickettsiales bacterium]
MSKESNSHSNSLSTSPTSSGDENPLLNRDRSPARQTYSEREHSPQLKRRRSDSASNGRAYSWPSTVKRASGFEKDLEQLKFEATRAKEEKVLTNDRTSSWFATFLGHTDEKKSMHKNFFEPFFSKLKKEKIFGTNVKEPFTVFDVGCGEGKLSRKVAKAIHTSLGVDNILYTAIDYDEKFVNLANLTLKDISSTKRAKNPDAKEPFETRKDTKYSDLTLIPTIHQGSCFVETDIDKISRSNQGKPIAADLVLASNIAYYAPNQEDFIRLLTKNLSTNGFIVLMHEAENADPNKLRKKYGAKVDTNTPGNLTTAGYTKKLEVLTIPFESHLNFPASTTKSLHLLKTLAEGYDIPNPEIIETKKLLEFIVQRPLESINKEPSPNRTKKDPVRTRLDDYLDEVKGLLVSQNSALVIRSTFQIIPSPQMSADKVGILRHICGEMTKDLKPSTHLTPQKATPVTGHALGKENFRK